MMCGVYIRLYGNHRSLAYMYGVDKTGTIYCPEENHYVDIIYVGTKDECMAAMPALKEKYNIK